MIRAIFCFVCCALSSAVLAAAGSLTQWVRPFAGTVGTGNTFPGACRPFGMVQPGPDTTDLHNPSGYERDQPTIRGFSATHLNGTGCAALGDVVLMPFTGETDGIDFGSPWDKAKEKAAPGYYAVTLDRFGTTAEITATERVSIYRFAWPKGAERKLLVDGATFLRDPWYAKDGQAIPSSCGGLSDDRREIAGSREFVSWVRAEVHYAVRFSRPVDTLVKLPRDGFEGAGDRWVCAFGVSDEPLEVRVAVSSVSPDGARGNLAEADGKTFDAVRTEADAEWESDLGRATIEGTDEQKRCFYTALYRLFVQPNNLADRDGRYRGADGKVRTAKGGRFYTTFSLWDTFRAAHPLYTILASERVPGFIDTFMDHARAHGHLPAWSLWGREAHCMIGMHAIPVLADAWAKGFRDFDPHEALGFMVNSMIGADKCWPKMDWGSYFEHGYLPCGPGPFDKGFVPGESVSRTLEYSYDWWCVSRFARQIGAETTARKADKWAAGWREVIDPETGFARGRAPGKGGWRTPFDPLENAQAGEFHGDYTEANAWIYTWHVFQDPDGLAERLGGREKALAKLDRFFATVPVRKEKVGGNNDLGGVAGDGQIGQYWHGNEPSHHIAYLYTVWGRPEKTAALVKRICAEAYKSADDGLCGNDDCGQMSAWYVLSMLGLYPFNPCGGEYVIGAPQVPMAQVKVKGAIEAEGRNSRSEANGLREQRKAFSVVARGLSKENKYVKSVTLNGKPITDWRIRHEDIVEGGELVFEMCALEGQCR